MKLIQAGFSMAADIWAVGVTAFELLAGREPWDPDEPVGEYK